MIFPREIFMLIKDQIADFVPSPLIGENIGRVRTEILRYV